MLGYTAALSVRRERRRRTLFLIRRDSCVVHLTHHVLIKVAALPALLWHSAQIAGGAAAMSVFGGLLIYATIISFTMFFQEQEDF